MPKDYRNIFCGIPGSIIGDKEALKEIHPAKLDLYIYLTLML